MMSPATRKLALGAHISVSVGWAGALAVFLAHAVIARASTDADIVNAAGLAMAGAAWFVILPLSLATLVTGLIQGLGTPWGLFRHYWILAKLILTIFATAILLLKLGPIDTVAAAGHLRANVDGLRMSLVVHAAGGLIVLLAAVFLAVYKPPGMTPFAGRVSAAANHSVFWKYSIWAGAMLLVALIVVMAFAGQHGPTAHLPALR